MATYESIVERCMQHLNPGEAVLEDFGRDAPSLFEQPLAWRSGNVFLYVRRVNHRDRYPSYLLRWVIASAHVASYHGKIGIHNSQVLGKMSWFYTWSLFAWFFFCQMNMASGASEGKLPILVADSFLAPNYKCFQRTVNFLHTEYPGSLQGPICHHIRNSTRMAFFISGLVCTYTYPCPTEARCSSSSHKRLL